MSDLRLSIIIPFYNVETQISDCLDSVCRQDIPLSEYEIICINDASQDHSKDIVLEYMNRYPNIKLEEHTYNKKLGAARNTGRNVAKGRYLWNVDSDDMIAPNCLKSLLQICENNELDVLDFNFKRLTMGEVKETSSVKPSNGVVLGLEYLETLNSKKLSCLCSVWQKIIRREFLDENNIFSPEINFGEDIPYSFRALILSKRLLVIEDSPYIYRTNPISLTGSHTTFTASTLYERSILDSKLVNEIKAIVPRNYQNVRISIIETAKYLLSLLFQNICDLSVLEQSCLNKRCRKEFFNNFHIIHLLGHRSRLAYFMWLLGIKKFPFNVNNL